MWPTIYESSLRFTRCLVQERRVPFVWVFLRLKFLKDTKKEEGRGERTRVLKPTSMWTSTFSCQMACAWLYSVYSVPVKILLAVAGSFIWSSSALAARFFSISSSSSFLSWIPIHVTQAVADTLPVCACWSAGRKRWLSCRKVAIFLWLLRPPSVFLFLIFKNVGILFRIFFFGCCNLI